MLELYFLIYKRFGLSNYLVFKSKNDKFKIKTMIICFLFLFSLFLVYHLCI